MLDQSEYVPRQAGLSKGSSGVNVRRLQNYLAQFGYLDSPLLQGMGVPDAHPQPAPESLGEFDDNTEAALRDFQRFVGLPVTGELDQATLDQMEKPRCGFVDTAAFNAQGNKWNTNNLRYGFVNFGADLTEAQVRAAFAAAFGYWAAVTPLTFTEVGIGDGPEIRIQFGAGDHGDGFPFDGPGTTLAHAFYPPPNGGDIAGDAHFDEDETWTIDLPPSGTDLYTVAAHEIGHALGLAHSDDADALMYPYYTGAHRFLDQDDIDGIQSIYGSAGWVSKVVQRVYVSHHAQNCWAFLQDIGWRKVQTGSADGVTNSFVGLCAARVHGIAVTAYVEDNTIRILYV